MSKTNLHSNKTISIKELSAFLQQKWDFRLYLAGLTVNSINHSTHSMSKN